MNAALEFHDSDVESIAVQGQTLTIRFSEACIHESQGVPGRDPGNVYVQQADLVFEAASWTPLPDVLGQLSDGEIQCGDEQDGLIRVPFVFVGDVRASFVFVSGETLSIKADGVRCTLDGKSRFLERFSG